MRDLVAGERAPIAGAQVLALAHGGGKLPTLALIDVGADRRASPAFPPIDAVTRELRPAAEFEGAVQLRLDLARVPFEIERLLHVAFECANRPIGHCVMIATAELRFSVDLVDRADVAVILVECYRHAGGWRIAAYGQGFASGLSAIAAAHGFGQEWENVNFGTKDAMILGFLDTFGIEPRMARDTATIGRAAVVRQAGEMIAPIAREC
ncbi:TerD family protein [Sphingomonas sp. NPDC079357]|uniref:TerD family protein n=1 Tax=Sphingomonas sp. NPDC079357 TaxID=3364518 RepID=UPI00384C7A30